MNTSVTTHRYVSVSLKPAYPDIRGAHAKRPLDIEVHPFPSVNRLSGKEIP
jgi:hypothetical protein